MPYLRSGLPQRPGVRRKGKKGEVNRYIMPVRAVEEGFQIAQEALVDATVLASITSRSTSRCRCEQS